MRQNRYFKKRIEILHTQWLKKIIKLSKTVTCLIINMILLIQINMLIDEKLLFQSKLKHCKLYHRNCCLTQYFKYQKYEHIVQICYQNQKCSLCVTSEYNNYSCVFWNKLNRYHYINYEESHLAWFFKYKIK